MHLSPLTLSPLTPSPLADVAPLGLSPSWIVLISAVLFVVYLTFRPKRRDPLAGQPFRTSLVQQRSLERDMQNVIVELSEMTRQMSAQLETRALKLEQLMHDADAKIDELTRAGEIARCAGVAIPGDLLSATVETIESAATPRPTMRLVTEHTEDRWAEIYQLADAGLTLAEIARRLGRPTGEIELILALRPRPIDAAAAATPLAAAQ